MRNGPIWLDRSTAEGMLLSVHCWSGAETCDIFLSTMTIWLLMSLISISEGIMLILLYSCPIFFVKVVLTWDWWQNGGSWRWRMCTCNMKYLIIKSFVPELYIWQNKREYIMHLLIQCRKLMCGSTSVALPLVNQEKTVYDEESGEVSEVIVPQLKTLPFSQPSLSPWVQFLHPWSSKNRQFSVRMHVRSVES